MKAADRQNKLSELERVREIHQLIKRSERVPKTGPGGVLVRSVG